MTSSRRTLRSTLVRLLLAGALTLGGALPAGADDVYLSSGYFNTHHYDVAMPLWLDDMTVARTYNSSHYKGFFGIGWETRLETNLEVQDDGSVLVREYGGGAYNQFSPTNKATRPMDTISSELAGVAAQTGRFGSDDELDSYSDWLDKNHAKEWARLRDLGLIVPQQSHAGEIFSSARFGENQFIIRVPEGYQRVTQGNGRFEAFDLSGRLERVWDVNRNFIALRYAGNRLAEISDNLGNRYAFTFNAGGEVTRIAGPGGRVALFEYAGDYLVKCTDATHSTYTYTYDSLHRMTGIQGPDGKWKRITYYSAKTDKVTSDNVVKAISNPDGTVTAYKYVSPDTPHLNVDVATTDAAGKTTDTTYQYLSRSGSWDLLATLVDGKPLEQRTYDASGRTLSVTKGTMTTNYRWDQYGNLAGATQPSAAVVWVYDDATGRVASATITGTGAKSWHYTYDARANLVHATDSDNRDVVLTYDEHGRRATAALGTQVLHFAYDQYFEPTKVWTDGVPAADISYNEIGDIKLVTGPGGVNVDPKLSTLVATIQGVITQANDDVIANYAAVTSAAAKIK
jgi:YD repeat-containing protein